jgi:EmrB/QacA subfamily drug resistance transporter
MKEQNLKRAALWVTTFASFLTPFMGSALNVALPTIGKQFGTDAILLNWIASAYILATAMVLLPVGRLADIIGRKKIFTLGIILFVITSFLCALSPDVHWLIAFRALQGFGSALFFGTGLAIISSVFPPGERGRALGINVAAVYVGLSMGPFVGGLLTQYLGWRSIFWFTIVIACGVLITILSYLKTEWAESRGEKFDLRGAILYALALVLIMYGFSKIPHLPGILMFLAGAGVFILFLYSERSLSFPLLETTLFTRNRTFAFSSLAALINYSATFAVGFLISIYLQVIKGLDPREAGLVMVSQPIIQALLSPLSGKISDRIEPRVVASIGMTLSVIGLISLSFIGPDTPLLLIILNLVLLGAGFALFSSPNTNAVMSSVERRFYGVASGTVGTMRMIGQMFSMAIALLMFSTFVGKVQLSAGNAKDIVLSMKASFLIFAVLCFIGIFSSLARGKLKREDML